MQFTSFIYLEEKLTRCFYFSLLLTKDESLLSNLLQQEAKKKEALRQAEVKYMKHKEQLQAAEKIVNANRMLLKKLQEQVG